MDWHINIISGIDDHCYSIYFSKSNGLNLQNNFEISNLWYNFIFMFYAEMQENEVGTLANIF